MSKNDIKNDPIRDFLINTIANFKENKIYILGFVSLIVLTVAAFVKSSAPGENDSIYCFDESIKNSEVFSDFCNEDNQMSSNVYMFIKSINTIMTNNEEDTSIENKISLMNEVDIDNIDSPILKSIFFRELGEMYIDNNNYESALECFSKSHELHKDDKSFSADVFYKKAYCFYEIGDLEKSKINIDKAYNCEYSDPVLSEKINFLIGKISYFRTN